MSTVTHTTSRVKCPHCDHQFALPVRSSDIQHKDGNPVVTLEADYDALREQVNAHIAAIRGQE